MADMLTLTTEYIARIIQVSIANAEIKCVANTRAKSVASKFHMQCSVGNISSEYACSGTLISKKHVITAAHCFAKVPHITTNCSSHDRYSINKILQVFTVRYGSNCLNPFFEVRCRNLDIALLELRDEIDDSANYICLPHRLISDRLISMVAFGWGSNPLIGARVMNVLQTISINRLMPYRLCRLKWTHIYQGQICTSEINTRGACTQNVSPRFVISTSVVMIGKLIPLFSLFRDPEVCGKPLKLNNRFKKISNTNEGPKFRMMGGKDVLWGFMPWAVAIYDEEDKVKKRVQHEIDANREGNYHHIHDWLWKQLRLLVAAIGIQQPNVLQMFTLRGLMPLEKCRKLYPNLPKDAICTREMQTRNVCFGDSGGGLLAKNAEKRWILLGVASFGTPCENLLSKISPPRAQIYTSLFYHNADIDQFIGDPLPHIQYDDRF
uniref:Peptidase S1 domain-containing protein n=1 Tax=Parascaris equorum TaxID=6256 RepID=A0A914RXW9_PAREQ